MEMRSCERESRDVKSLQMWIGVTINLIKD